jgi:hypothetical protein
MTMTSLPPSPQAQAMLKALKEAVRKSLDKKKRLGQYAVTWQDGRPVLVGEDAPKVSQ